MKILSIRRSITRKAVLCYNFKGSGIIGTDVAHYRDYGTDCWAVISNMEIYDCIGMLESIKKIMVSTVGGGAEIRGRLYYQIRYW